MNIPDYPSIMNRHFERIMNNIDFNRIDLKTKEIRNYAPELEKAQKMAEGSIQPTVIELAKAATQAFQHLEESRRRIQMGAINSYLDQQQAFNDHINKIINKSALNAATTNLHNIEASIAALEQIQNIPFEELEKIYEEEFDEISENELNEPDNKYFLSSLLLYFRKKATELPNGEVSALGLAQLAATCLLIYISLKSSAEADRDRDELIRIEKKKIEVFKNKLSPCLQELAESNEEEFVVSTKRECPIRSTPTAEADTLTRAFPGKEVEVIDSLNRWYQINYFDATDTTIRTGFIYKGHVQQ